MDYNILNLSQRV